MKSKIYTKKKRGKKIDSKLWDKFDEDILGKSSVECIYTDDKNESEKTHCEECGSMLRIDDLKFLTCTNRKCGIIYKDQLDLTAEWRYYGVDDNKHSDPTRCGMPASHHSRGQRGESMGPSPSN